MNRQEINCYNKIQYSSLEKAEEFCRYIKNKYHAFNRPYYCKICGNYHTTTKIKL